MKKAGVPERTVNERKRPSYTYCMDGEVHDRMLKRVAGLRGPWNRSRYLEELVLADLEGRSPHLEMVPSKVVGGVV
jgi:hypothetical protein